MFQNISFSFLSALAFISWSVLCYLHFIEEHKKHEDYIVEIYTENAYPTHLPRYYQHVVKPPKFMSRAYELLISYGVVLATTVVLSKVLQIIEVETITYMQRIGESKLENPFKDLQYSGITRDNELDSSAQDNKILKEQLNDLQIRCQELLDALSSGSGDDDISYNGELYSHPSNSSLSDASSDILNTYDNDVKTLCNSNSSEITATQCSSGIESPSMRQIVYVTHSHIHINFNAPVTLSHPNTTTDMLHSARVHRGSEFLQVWSKYIKDSNERPMLTGFNNLLL